MTSEALKALAERVEGATGPDINIDYALAAEFGRPWVLPRYTASIDAALGLVERVLPGAIWYRCHGDDFNVKSVEVWWRESERHEWIIAEALDKGSTPLAILSALLRALLAKGE